MGVFGSIFGNKNADQDFWQWFKVNTDQLAQVETCEEPIANELHRRLNKVCKGLVFLFGPEIDGKKQFVVSAGGIRKLFPDVQRLVQVAPDIPGWKIIAFRPPVKDINDFRLRFGNAEFRANDVWFSITRSSDQFDLNVFVRIFDGVGQDVINQAAFLMLDHTIGEYAVETKINRITFDSLPIDPVASGLHPLAMLPNMMS